MELVIEIPPQKATNGVARQGVLSNCFSNGTLIIEARDFKKPALISITPKDFFPWDVFIKKLLILFRLGVNDSIPYAFRPLKKIPDLFLEKLSQESTENQLKILALLRKNNYFPPLKKI